MHIIEKKSYDIHMFLSMKEIKLMAHAIRLRSQELENKMGLNEEELEEKSILKSFLLDVEKLMKEQMF
ncbi:hypothetical protein EAL2_808p03310 (plasmid) [Peptoclostridium acidaminophilum DSM 3953]|uniref:Uncharacterized protein n=1 Tax=Peptoclostridium acidaminophilum DSM 3953 TaxID=1286171 RepID=W8UAL0_PEPAC|nr:hypothetical protein [Peptoclostridium acidaminophilum]AHM57836.1 hypothetical protein EAL2_808p03310 [Peptoclostridium acidaminophilum DSM 3953]